MKQTREQEQNCQESNGSKAGPETFNERKFTWSQKPYRKMGKTLQMTVSLSLNKRKYQSKSTKNRMFRKVQGHLAMQLSTMNKFSLEKVLNCEQN